MGRGSGKKHEGPVQAINELFPGTLSIIDLPGKKEFRKQLASLYRVGVSLHAAEKRGAGFALGRIIRSRPRWASRVRSSIAFISSRKTGLTTRCWAT